jgi:hypothetical protein
MVSDADYMLKLYLSVVIAIFGFAMSYHTALLCCKYHIILDQRIGSCERKKKRGTVM